MVFQLKREHSFGVWRHLWTIPPIKVNLHCIRSLECDVIYGWPFIIYSWVNFWVLWSICRLGVSSLPDLPTSGTRWSPSTGWHWSNGRRGWWCSRFSPSSKNVSRFSFMIYLFHTIFIHFQSSIWEFLLEYNFFFYLNDDNIHRWRLCAAVSTN